jgi:hypothetical protein
MCVFLSWPLLYLSVTVDTFLKNNNSQADGLRPGEEGYDPRTLYIPSNAWTKFTPFERQFWEVKCKHYDTVLFFQKGKFFERESRVQFTISSKYRANSELFDNQFTKKML